MAWYKLSTTVNFGIYTGLTVKEVADKDWKYLIWLHNSKYNIYLCKSVFDYLHLWNTYKDTPLCKRAKCLQG